MNIGIITLATGKYSSYLTPFLESFKQYFFPSLNREFVYLTDDTTFTPSFECKHLYFPHEKWPMATLNKPKAINLCKPLLKTCDVVFWCDVDLRAVDLIENQDDVFPKDKSICCVNHCGWLDDNKNEIIRYPYETNPKSLAYVSDLYKVPYHQACFFGGYYDEFFKMTEILEKNIQTDLDNRIIAIYHDESHLNRYFQDMKPKTIPKTYARPIAMGKILDNTKIISILKNDEDLRNI